MLQVDNKTQPCLKLKDFGNKIGMGNRGGVHHATCNVRSIKNLVEWYEAGGFDDDAAAATIQEYGPRSQPWSGSLASRLWSSNFEGGATLRTAAERRPFRSKRERSSFSKPDIDSAGTVGGEGYFVGQVYQQLLPFPMKRPFTN